jgi:hypothetical protein
MANTFDWVEIQVTDIERAADFYKGLFGWSVIERDAADGSDVCIFDTGGTPRTENLSRGGLWLRPAGERLGVVVYVVVEDIDATLRQASALGGQVIVPRAPQGPHFRACFSDPDGNVLGLWEEPSGGTSQSSTEDAA